MERSFPFNAVVTDGVPDRVYTAEDFAAERAAFVSDGVLSGDALTVSPLTGMSVSVSPGCAVIRGRTYENTEPLTLTLAPAGELPRSDRVVLRLSLSERRAYCAILTGTAAAEPVPPAPADDAMTKELPLCTVSVAAGAVSLTEADLTDERVRADYVLNRVDVDSVLARYESALSAYFGTQDAQAIARAAAVVSTDAGADAVLCGDGAYRVPSRIGPVRAELTRFTSPGDYTFDPAEHPAADGTYEFVLQGAGGSGAHGLTGSGAQGGSAGEFVRTPPIPLRPGVCAAIRVGSGGTGVYEANGTQRGGRSGGATTLTVLGESFRAEGGAGGGIEGNRNWPPDESPRAGSTVSGAPSLLADGGANYTGTSVGEGIAGTLGSGGGTSFTPAYLPARRSAPGGDGAVIVYGIV